MTILQLSYIIAVSEEKSISKASEKLRVAQPSISRIISSIEQEYNVTLFKRNGHTMELTQIGKLFVEKAQKIIMEYKNLESIMADLGNDQNLKLSFGCSSNHISYMVPRLLHSLCKKFSDLEISVVDDSSSNLYRQLVQGKIDLLYSHIPPALDNSNDIEFIPIAKEELLLVVSPTHPLAARAEGIPDWRMREPINVEDIKDEIFIQLRKDHSIRIMTDRIFAKHNITPNVKFEIRTNDIAHRLAASGLGVTLLPESEVRFNETIPNCIYFPIEDRTYSRQIYISYLKSLYKTSVISECIKTVSDIAGQLFDN